MEIAKSKGEGELPNWDDIQKMKYSWNVACEAIRLMPPAQGAFREAITDFTFGGFTIPKGWKTFWNVYSTHKIQNIFQSEKNLTLVDLKEVNQHHTLLYHLVEDQECVQEKNMQDWKFLFLSITRWWLPVTGPIYILDGSSYTY
ncbi:hypothetical protein AABB24_035651 [Solanum stoloniferum]|uniref:Uncharacterized protein n=1 Tax=Solanum stoloniferum TaxID=62892 RepID=A0ABD2R8R6_9SOLN